MCDFIRNKIYQEMIPTRNDPHFFRVYLFIPGPLQAKYSIQRNSVMENNKNKAYGQLTYQTKH